MGVADEPAAVSDEVQWPWFDGNTFRVVALIIAFLLVLVILGVIPIEPL